MMMTLWVTMCQVGSVMSSYNILVLLFREGDYEELMVNYEKRIKCISREESVIFLCSAVVT